MDIKKDKFLVFLYICAVFAGIILIFSIFYSLPLEKKSIGVRFMVGENPGFDLNASEVIFGRVPPGGGSSRNMIMRNDHSFTIKVRTFVSSDISSFVNVESGFFIAPNSTRVISANLHIPKNTPFGNYSGKIIFEIRRK